MTEASNLEAMKTGYAAFAKGDVEALRRLLAPGVRYRHAPMGAFAGDYRGQQAVLDFFTELANVSEGSYSAVPTAMAAGGDVVFVRHHSTGRRAGKTLDTEQIAAFTFADGAVVDVVLSFCDWPSDAAFWS